MQQGRAVPHCPIHSPSAYPVCLFRSFIRFSSDLLASALLRAVQLATIVLVLLLLIPVGECDEPKSVSPKMLHLVLGASGCLLCLYNCLIC